MVETVLGAGVVVLGVVAAWPDPPPRPKPTAAAAHAPADPGAPPAAPAEPPGLPPEIAAAQEQTHRAVVKEWEARVAADPYPLKRDPVRAADVRAAHLMAYRAGTVAAFERTPGRDAPWAGLAAKAHDLRARMLTEEALTGVVPEPLVRADRAALAAAVRAGCDDPLVVYWNIRATSLLGWPADLGQFRRAVDRVCESDYPAVRRVHAALNWLAAVATLPPDSPFREDQEDREDRFWELFDDAVRERTLVADEELAALAARWEAYRRGLGRPREQALSELDRHIRRAGGRPYLRQTVRGAGLVRVAWDARGGGFAGTVTEAGWQVFYARLQDAQRVLAEAAEADPDGYTAPTAMLSVCMGLGLDREEAEDAFRCALAANPFNRTACHAKLEILHPKWQGSPDGTDYLSFAWALALHPPEYEFQQVALNSLLRNQRISAPAGLPGDADVHQYFSTPAVWSLVRTAAEQALRVNPDDGYVRSVYARVACAAAQLAVAREQFTRLGDAFSPLVFADRFEYDAHRRTAGVRLH
jgi:tetratricopeptide (TPR) repeat protein